MIESESERGGGGARVCTRVRTYVRVRMYAFGRVRTRSRERVPPPVSKQRVKSIPTLLQTTAVIRATPNAIRLGVLCGPAALVPPEELRPVWP